MDWDYEKNGEQWIAREANEKRADYAEAAVEKFREVCSGDNDMTAIYDLIADLGHLFDRVKAEHVTEYEDGFDFGHLLDRAQMHFDAETGEGDDIEQAMG